MGYQESFIQFDNMECLVSEIRKYQERDKECDLADVVGVDRVKMNIPPFQVGELLAVVCGERSAQRLKVDMNLSLGLQNIKNIVFLDDIITGDKSFDDYFESLTKEEFKRLILSSN